MLELLIALWLAAFAAFPLAQMPLRAANEQMKTLYRLQASRAANSGFALVKEKLYTHQISWAEIYKAKTSPLVLFKDTCSLGLKGHALIGCQRKATLKYVSSKKKGAEEWWLMMATIELSPQKKKSSLFKKGKKGKDSKKFSYYILLHHSNNPV